MGQSDDDNARECLLVLIRVLRDHLGALPRYDDELNRAEVLANRIDAQRGGHAPGQD